MPLGEVEHHPYLQLGITPGANKLILGSFPVYECTNPENDLKHEMRGDTGMRFFYGSGASNFWSKYSQYIDNNLTQPWNPDYLVASLRENRISISDLIQSCQRVGNSSLDNDLKHVTWNSAGIRNLLNTGVLKILCTSKGVLGHLESRIICNPENGIGTVYDNLTYGQQIDFLEQIGGNYQLIKRPIIRAFNINGIFIEAIALPSPGSPWRQLRTFGFDGNDWSAYYDAYLQHAFHWFMEE